MAALVSQASVSAELARRKDADDATVEQRAAQAAQTAVPKPKAQRNFTDPDSRIMHTRDGFRQAFNGQAVVTSDQVILAAEVVPENTDLDAFHPMLDAARNNLDAAGVADPLKALRTQAATYLDGLGWQPLSSESDPAAAYRRILLSVFPDESREAGLAG